MMLCFFAYTFYLPGDEDIIMDSAVLSSTTQIEELQNVNVFPNPASDMLQVQFYDHSVTHYDIIVYDLFGLNVYSERSVTVQQNIDIRNWAEGMYAVELYADGRKKSFKILKQGE